MKQIKDIISKCYSKSEVIREMGWTDSGSSRRKIDDAIRRYGIDISHFQLNRDKKKYIEITKTCPVCNKVFVTRNHPKKEGTTCSKSCAATWFKTGDTNPNWKGKSYRNAAFKKYGHKCFVCDETKVLDVHHLDGNHNNNSVENILPMCPTHHRYLHSKYKQEIETKINEILGSTVIEA